MGKVKRGKKPFEKKKESSLLQRVMLRKYFLHKEKTF